MSFGNKLLKLALVTALVLLRLMPIGLKIYRKRIYLKSTFLQSNNEGTCMKDVNDLLHKRSLNTGNEER